jgi:anti-sigma factor RsiW
MTELSDELLVAYVDGQLAREQIRAVEKVLAKDDVIARRVAALQEAHGRLEAAFEAILASELGEVTATAPSAPPERREAEPRRWRAMTSWAAAGIVIGLMAAVAIQGWPLSLPDLVGMRETLFPRPPEAPALPAWQADAARAQSLLSRASVEVGLESQSNRDFIAYQLAEAIGPDMRLPNLEPQGFRFVRAQILRYGDQPLAQLLYLPAKRDPLSLYAMEGHRDRLPVFAQEAGIGTVFWCEEGIAYLLAGREDEATLYRLAEKIRNEPLPTEAPAPPEARAVATPAPDATVTPEVPPPAALAPAETPPAAPDAASPPSDPD